MNTIRAFIAVEIPLAIKEKLSLLISDLKKSNANVKWVGIEGLHFTLKFLGDIEKDKVGDISKELKKISSSSSIFSVKFSKIGAFPNMNKPRVIWLGISQGENNLISLNKKIELSMEELGFQKEGREYKAHLTLGRVRSFENISQLAKIINSLKIHIKGSVEINKIVLYQSTLTPKGAIYTPLSDHTLTIS
ncbi:MAG: RNA 2',3'-cyclic phosphodiesterase [Candidatus Omnitrophota bacterium]